MRAVAASGQVYQRSESSLSLVATRDLHLRVVVFQGCRQLRTRGAGLHGLMNDHTRSDATGGLDNSHCLYLLAALDRNQNSTAHLLGYAALTSRIHMLLGSWPEKVDFALAMPMQLECHSFRYLLQGSTIVILSSFHIQPEEMQDVVATRSDLAILLLVSHRPIGGVDLDKWLLRDMPGPQ
jgi:hypothetical protein